MNISIFQSPPATYQLVAGEVSPMTRQHTGGITDRPVTLPDRSTGRSSTPRQGGTFTDSPTDTPTDVQTDTQTGT